MIQGSQGTSSRVERSKSYSWVWEPCHTFQGTKGEIVPGPESTLLKKWVQFNSVQSLSRVRLFATPWIAARPAFLSITNSRNSLKLMSVESVMPSSHLILCHPLFLLPPIPPSIRVFSNKSTLRMRWPKYWSFSFSIILSKEHPGLISFRMDWLDQANELGVAKRAFSGGLVVRNPSANAGNTRDAGAIPKSEDLLEKEMASHSSIIACEIPWMEEPGKLQSMGCKSRTQLSD